MIFNWLFGNKERDLQFAQWLEHGAKQEHPELLASLNGSLMHLGTLSVPSGKMVIQDPSDKLVDPCFDELVPPGNYSVDAVVATKNDDHRIAAARVKIADGEISHFEPAWTAHWRSITAKRKELPWFSVDSALAAVCSFESLNEFQKLDLDQVDVSPAIDGKSENLFKETTFPDGSNMFIMQAGYGDGGYHCYWAKTDDGQQIALIADFGLLGKPSRII
ncbi:MAG: DUF4241 domain-containing protein [Candidatus Obscuribacterales bacterium]|nr:DUF4241 domain-containing protein [Candidatus Obscuribacterales bacterium]